MRVGRVSILILLMAVVALAGCSRGLEGVTRDFSTGAVSERSVSTVAVAAAKSTNREGQPPITVESVVLSGVAPSQVVTVVVDLEMAADSWDAAFRAAQFGSLLIPSLFSRSDVATVTVSFGEQGGELVDYSFTRTDSGQVDWDAQLDALRRTDGASWPSFFQAASCTAHIGC